MHTKHHTTYVARKPELLLIVHAEALQKMFWPVSTCLLFGSFVEVFLQFQYATIVFVLKEGKTNHFAFTLFVHLEHHPFAAVSQEVAVFRDCAVLRHRNRCCFFDFRCLYCRCCCLTAHCSLCYTGEQILVGKSEKHKTM